MWQNIACSPDLRLVNQVLEDVDDPAGQSRIFAVLAAEDGHAAMNQALQDLGPRGSQSLAKRKVGLNEEVDHPRSHVLPLAVEAEGPDHLELPELAWQALERELRRGSQPLLLFFLVVGIVVPAVGVGPLGRRLSHPRVASLLSLGCLSLEVALLLVEREEVELEELEALGSERLDVELLAGNLLGEEFSDLAEVHDRRLGGL